MRQRAPVFHTWRGEREVTLPLRKLGTTEAWTWLSKGSKKEDPEGLMFVPFGVFTKAHWHAPREDFRLIQGKASARVGSRSAWKTLSKNKKLVVGKRKVHSFRATSREGAWIYFRFKGYKKPWSTMRYHFTKKQ
tara:strand:- start:239 stop:640 length:402 start_codon:yes stop_codon:yes gene_type:complete